MSNFQAGDIIRYTGSGVRLRQVIEVNDDVYIVTDNLFDYQANGSTPPTYREEGSYLAGNYELVIRPVIVDFAEAHKADMATLSRNLSAEARARGWCSDYERIVDRWNTELNVPLEPHPSVNVRTTATVTVTIERTDEVTDGLSPADWAENKAYTPNSTNVTFPDGWTVRDVRTTAHSGAAVV